MRKIIVSILFFLAFISFSNAQCVEDVDLKSPHYQLGYPLHLEVNELDDLKDSEVTYVTIEGNSLNINDSSKKLIHRYSLTLEEENKQEEDAIISYKINNLKGYTATVTYRKESNCIGCDIYIYNEAKKLVFKVQADRLFEVQL